MKARMILPKSALLGLAYLGLLAGSGVAAAATVYNWTYVSNDTSISAVGTATVAGGIMTGGSGTINGGGFVNETLSLLTLASTGASPYSAFGPTGYWFPTVYAGTGWAGDLDWSATGPDGTGGPLFAVGSGVQGDGAPSYIFNLWGPTGTGNGGAALYGSGGTQGDLDGSQWTQGTLSVSAVPLPAAVWLLGSGLIGLVGIGRRRRAA